MLLLQFAFFPLENYKISENWEKNEKIKENVGNAVKEILEFDKANNSTILKFDQLYWQYTYSYSLKMTLILYLNWIPSICKWHFIKYLPV